MPSTRIGTGLELSQSGEREPARRLFVRLAQRLVATIS
jgi:hypothetical protein